MNAKTLFFLSLLALNANADVYKCEINGKTVYQDSPAASCQGVGIDTTGPNPEQMARIIDQRDRNTRDYQQGMDAYRRQWSDETGARTAAIAENTRLMQINTGIIRADTRRILNDIGVIHPPVYGTSLFPMPVTITNPHYRPMERKAIR